METYILIANLLLTGFVGILVWLQREKIEHLKVQLDEQRHQYATNNEIYATFTRRYNENYPFLNSLAEKDGASRENLRSKLTRDEREKWDQMIAELNIILNHLFVTSPDEKYAKLVETWEEGGSEYKNYGNKILVAMRLMNYPSTKYNKPSDIKVFFYK